MIALVLVGALIAHSSVGTPTGNANIGSRNALQGGSVKNPEQNEIGTSALPGNDVNPNADWITYRPSAASMPYSEPPSLKGENEVSSPLDEELMDSLQNLVNDFVYRYNKLEGTPAYKRMLNEVASKVERRFYELSFQLTQHEPTRTRFQQLKTYFETFKTSVRLRLDYIEEEQRLQAEREAESRRTERLQSTTPGSADLVVGHSNSRGNQLYLPPDMVAMTVSLQQYLNRLQQEAFQFNRFNMRLNPFNVNSIVAEAELAAANLQSSINALSDASRSYQNTDVFAQAEDLRMHLQGLLQKLKTGL